MNFLYRRAFFTGALDILPILTGVIPFGAIVGVTLVNINLDPTPAIAMSSIIYAGAAQLAVANLMDQQTPFLIILITALVINLRMLMYSASLAPHFSHLLNRWKWPMAYLVSDQAYAVSISAFTEGRFAETKRWYYLGAGIAMWMAYQTGTVMGVVLGLHIPSHWALDFAIPVTFIALMVPAIKDIASLLAAVSAGLISLVSFDLPMHTGIMVSAGCGIIVGYGVEMFLKSRGTSDGK